MAESKGTILSRLIIIAFATAVVALGANELHREYQGRYAGIRPAPAAMEELHGSNVIERAQMRTDTLPRSSGSKESVSQADRKQLQSLIDSVSN